MNIREERKHTTYFLIGSFALLLMISAGAFLCLGYYMSKVSKKAINEVGNLYMTGMNEEITAHFKTLMELKLEQAEAVVVEVPTDIGSNEDMYEELTHKVHVRNFNYLALCSEDGELEMLHGEQIQLADPEPFFRSLRKKEKKVAVGQDVSGNELVMFGISAEYPMRSRKTSMAIVAALPIENISMMLNTEDEVELMFSHIIRQDGSFIISDMSAAYSDYFSSLYEKYDEKERETIDQYIREISDAMEKKKNYSVVLDFDGRMEQIYCTSLPYSEWHLVTVLPFGVLNETVDSVNRDRTIATIMVFSIILIVLLFIFYMYFTITCEQMNNLETARQEALQATKAKSEFLSNMSHDIRTPMNAIVGMTAIAAAHIDDKEQVRNCLKKIALSGKHLLGLINDVLDMSKIESGKMTLTAERISLQEVVEGIVSIVQSQAKAKEQIFHVHIDHIVAEDVYCDSVRLNQVLLNLLSNAVKYTQEGGTIGLSLFQEEISSDENREKSDPNAGGMIRTHIMVEDNGIGMSAEFLEHIFDAYSRADSKRVQKTEGAGLGMAITKYIVDAMKGSLDVESQPGYGTKFHLTLDLEKAGGPEENMILPPWNMLVVDDDEVLCRTAVDALKSIGVHAEWTMSGKKAISMVEKHHQMGDDYQIILLDWKLPDMDGLLVARQIRRIVDMDMPVILISAYDWSEFETEAREAGITGFIAKPLFKSTLFHGLRKYMDVEVIEDKKEKDMDLSGCRLLVAEDNELNWEILQELLSDIGMELEWAENGKICMEKFRTSEKGRYDGILMDVRMPVMNGYEATRAIRALEHPDAQTIPIIAMTADAFSEDIQHCLDSGMNAHTAKPINLDEVISLLKRYIV